jgi:hypothetical protein
MLPAWCFLLGEVASDFALVTNRALDRWCGAKLGRAKNDLQSSTVLATVDVRIGDGKGVTS